MAANDAVIAHGHERAAVAAPPAERERAPAGRSPAPSPRPAATGARPSGASSSGTRKIAARWRIAIAPNGGATSSAVATMPGSVPAQALPDERRHGAGERERRGGGGEGAER